MFQDYNLVDAPRKTTTTTGGSFDGRKLQQLLDTTQVQKLPVNYNIEDQGRIEKRAGRRELLEVSGGLPILFQEKVTDILDVFSYGTTVSLFNKVTNLETVIKDDFSAGIIDGVRIGTDVFVCNGVGGDKIYKIDSVLESATEESNAPKCERLFYFNESLVAGNTNTDTNEVHVAKQNDPTTWTTGDNAGDPYKVQFKRAGEVTEFGSLDNQGIENQGNQLFIGYKDGYVLTHNDVLDVGGTLTQRVVIDVFKLNAGVESAESTAQGVYYSNEQGIFLRRVGQDRNSDDINLSRNFGKELDDFSFVGSQMLFVPKFNRLLVLCRREKSSSNNSVLVHNTETTFTEKPSWWRFQGWRLNTIHLDGDSVYGGSSLDTKLYLLFTGSNDAGSPIVTSYEQILNVNNFKNIGDLLEIYAAGELTFGFDQTIAFDIIDEVGNTVTPPNNSVTFGADSIVPDLAGIGTAGIGFTGIGGTVFSKSTSFTRKWKPLKIYGFSALLLKITGSDRRAHQINWIATNTTQRRSQRKGLMN